MARNIAKILSRKKIMTSKELERVLGSRVAIKRQVALGTILPLGTGLYSSPEFDPFTAGILAAKKFYPNGVISNLSALVVHQLSDEVLNKIDIDIENTTSIRNRFLNVHRVIKKRLVGVMKMLFHGEQIRIYDLERTLCEAYKIDPAGAIFFKALKRYLKKGKPKPEAIGAIARYDEALGTDALLHIKQELADE